MMVSASTSTMISISRRHHRAALKGPRFDLIVESNPRIDPCCDAIEQLEQEALIIEGVK